MKRIIIYASKTGVTENCAEMLKKYLDDIEVVNINNLKGININNYEQIIIGSYIRIGMINKEIKNFITVNHDILKQKQTAFFVCCGFSENSNKYFSENIPADLLENAIVTASFGGELDLAKQKGFDKFIVKMVTKKTPDQKVAILIDNIVKFAEEIKK